MKTILQILAMSMATTTLAAEFDYKDGATITMDIDQNLGSMVELPYPVKVVPMTKSFEITAIETETGENGTPQNIRILNVKPFHAIATRELVPIILDGGRSLNLVFVSKVASDRHHRIRLPKTSTLKLKGFLEKETYLMVQMLKDEEADGYKKERARQKLSVSGYKEFDLYLVRKYVGGELNGYIFQMVNKTDGEIKINPTALNFAAPNRAALLQMDSDTLAPCKSKEPRTKPCASAIRIVLRGESYNKFSTKSDLPFFLNQPSGKEVQ